MYGRGYNGVADCFGFGPGFMFGGGGMMLMLAAGVLLVLAVVLIARRGNRGKADKDVMEVLKMRFVNGEISEEEYIRRKNILG